MQIANAQNVDHKIENESCCLMESEMNPLIPRAKYFMRPSTTVNVHISLEPG